MEQLNTCNGGREEDTPYILPLGREREGGRVREREREGERGREREREEERERRGEREREREKRSIIIIHTLNEPRQNPPLHSCGQVVLTLRV